MHAMCRTENPATPSACAPSARGQRTESIGKRCAIRKIGDVSDAGTYQ